jgi:transcriptional regulator with XRE-family HTH domain
MNYHKLTQDIIRIARQDCSQRELSERLGYSFNKIGKIESAQTSVKWSEFIGILSSLKIDILDHLESFFYNYKSNDWVGASFGDHLLGEFALKSIDDTRVQKINKKLKTKFDSIDLADILSVLNTRPSMLVGFLHPIVNINEIPELKNDFDNYQQSANIIAEDPAIAFINCSLVIKDYLEKDKHCDETLALHADCTVQ